MTHLRPVIGAPLALVSTLAVGCAARYELRNSPFVTSVTAGWQTRFHRDGATFRNLRDAVQGNESAERRADASEAMRRAGVAAWLGAGLTGLPSLALYKEHPRIAVTSVAVAFLASLFAAGFHGVGSYYAIEAVNCFNDEVEAQIRAAPIANPPPAGAEYWGRSLEGALDRGDLRIRCRLRQSRLPAPLQRWYLEISWDGTTPRPARARLTGDGIELWRGALPFQGGLALLDLGRSAALTRAVEGAAILVSLGTTEILALALR